MELQMMAINDLIPYVNNPRQNDDAVDAVASSIKNFGFKVPIVIDGQNEIINGHTRLKAAKKLGLNEVPVIVADDLTPEQIKAFRLADNKVSEIAEWDEDLLAIELEELENLDFDMSDFGFEEDEKLLPVDDEDVGEGKTFEHVLRIDKTQVIMTDDGYEKIINLLDRYIEENGVSFGFVEDLLCNI